MSRRDIETKGLAFLAEVKKSKVQFNLSKEQSSKYERLLLEFQHQMLSLTECKKWDSQQLRVLQNSAVSLYNFIVEEVKPQGNEIEGMTTSCTDFKEYTTLVREQLAKKTPNWQTFLFGFGLLLVGAAIFATVFFIPPVGVVLGSVALSVALESFIIPIAIGMIAGSLALLGVGGMVVSFTLDKPKLDGMSKSDIRKQLVAEPEVVLNNEDVYQPRDENSGRLDQKKHDNVPQLKGESNSETHVPYPVSKVSIFTPGSPTGDFHENVTPTNSPK